MGSLGRRAVLAGLAGAPLLAHRVLASGADRPLARARLPLLARGYNLPGVTDVPADQSRLPGMELLAHLAALGLTSVRLPVEPRLVLDDPSHVDFVDEVIDTLLACGTAVTIDLHPDVETASILERDPRNGSELVRAAWDRLVPLARAKPPEAVLLELLNEPALPQSEWRTLRARLVSNIRDILPEHTLVWGAAANQTIEETLEDGGPDDDNAIAAVHFYYPMIFTHQGMSWAGSELARIHGFPFPFSADDPVVTALRGDMARAEALDSLAAIDAETAQPWTEARIAQCFTPLRDWAAATGWPVVLNEFGAFNDHAPVESRARWLRAVRGSAESCGFGWNHWELDGGFGFTGSRDDIAAIDATILDALVGP